MSVGDDLAEGSVAEMDLQTYLQALAELSPMPDDDVLEATPERIDQYANLLDAIRRKAGDRFDPAVIETLVNSFGVGDGGEVYWSTVHLIEQFGSDSTYALLRRAAMDGPPGARKWCCLLLGRRRQPEDLSVLISRLHDSEPRVVYEALRAIKMIAQRHRIPNAIPDVQSLIGNPRASIATAARDALESLFS